MDRSTRALWAWFIMVLSRPAHWLSLHSSGFVTHGGLSAYVYPGEVSNKAMSIHSTVTNTVRHTLSYPRPVSTSSVRGSSLSGHQAAANIGILRPQKFCGHCHAITIPIGMTWARLPPWVGGPGGWGVAGALIPRPHNLY